MYRLRYFYDDLKCVSFFRAGPYNSNLNINYDGRGRRNLCNIWSGSETLS